MRWRQRSILHLFCIGVALLVSGCGGRGLLAQTREPLDLTILHTGQVSGEILPCG
jgi:hypothetical protein